MICPGPKEDAPMTILQLTASFFFLPAWVAATTNKPLGAVIYAANGCVSIVVHRPSRLSNNFDNIDVIDHVCVAVWVAYNAYLFVSAPSVEAAACALGVLLTKWRTLQLLWRTPSRYCTHAFMHLFGAVGSLFLLH